jgi:hypothetical protein
MAASTRLTPPDIPPNLQTAAPNISTACWSGPSTHEAAEMKSPSRSRGDGARASIFRMTMRQLRYEPSRLPAYVCGFA